MEETKETKVTALNAAKDAPVVEAKKEQPAQFDAAQLQEVLKQADMRMRQMAENIQQLSQMLKDKTIDQLFSVLKYAVHFDTDFVDKSAQCIQTYLTNVAFSDAEEKPEVVEAEKEV